MLERENNTGIEKAKSSKKKIVMAIVTVMILSFAVFGVAKVYNSPAKQLEKQLNLGNHYLEEMDYEQAIVAFNEAIEIDPKNVDAYLGKAEAYLGLDDYDMALQTLQEGYEKTGDVKFLDGIQAINENVASPVVAEQIENEIVIENEEEEGAYPVLILEDDIKDLFDNIIQYCLNENYWEAIDVLWDSEFFELSKQCASQKEFSWESYQGIQEYSGSTTLFIKTVYENYHIYIDYDRVQTSEIGMITFVFLPESGLGGMVSSHRFQKDNVRFSTGEDLESVKQDGYMICNTADYNFNGDYILHSISDYVKVGPKDVLRTDVVERQENGKLKDNLYDGTITREKYRSGTSELEEWTYDKGILQPQITEDGSYECMRYNNLTGEWQGGYIYNEEHNSKPRGIIQACDEYSAFIEQAPWE